MGWWSDLLRKKAEVWIFEQLDASQAPNEFDSKVPIPVDGAYLTITLKSMRIVNVRILTTRFYGVVNSFISLNHLSGNVASFQAVTTPAELQKIDAKHVDKIIPRNIPLIGPVPYRGEKISFELGLFSVKEQELAGPFIKLLENMSKIAGVSVLTAAIPYVQPLKDGMEAIAGTSDDTVLNIGVSTTWNPPSTGWYLVMGAPKEKVDISSLQIAQNNFTIVEKATGNPLKDYPYMVFSITSSREREDWFLLPYLKDAYQNLQKAVRDGRRTDAEELLTIFKRMALTSDDLLTDDALRIVKLVEDKARHVMSATMVSKGVDEMPDLKNYPLYLK